MTTTRPAISTLALPALESSLRIEVGRGASPIYAKLCGTIRADLERQIEAARTGAATWTDTAGSTWGPGHLLVGGTVPVPGGHSLSEPLGY